MEPLEQLLAISSGSLGWQGDFRGAAGGLLGQLQDLLSQRNGFYAFESALLVRPYTAAAGSVPMDLWRWNSDDLWRQHYEQLMPPALFFAEDILGNQFGILDEKIIWFDAETGDWREFADDLRSWAGKVLDDYYLHTGYRIAHDWQVEHGPIPMGHRLALKRPFVLGGSADLDSLLCWPDVKIMKGRGFMAVHIAQVEPGGSIMFVLVDDTDEQEPDGGGAAGQVAG